MGVLFICLKRIKLRVLIKRVSFYGVSKCAFVIDIEEGALKYGILLPILICVGCSGYSVTGGPGKTIRPRFESSVFNAEGLREINSLSVSPLVVEQGAAEAISGSEDAMYDKLVNAIKTEMSIEAIPVRDTKKIIAESGMYPHAKWLTESARMGLDGMLVLRLHNYNLRKGSAVGADEGASVGFLMSVYRVADGKELWRGNYYFQDKALSENIFRLSRSGEKGWVSAETLFEQGLQLAIRDFALKRVEAFSGK